MLKRIERKKDSHGSSAGTMKPPLPQKGGKHDPKELAVAVQKVKELREHIEDLIKHGKFYIKALQCM
jgi:hypothetical protein